MKKSNAADMVAYFFLGILLAAIFLFMFYIGNSDAVLILENNLLFHYFIDLK